MKVGLARLGTAFGNGDADCQTVQIDHQWPEYRRNKLRARAESLDKYYCTVADFDDDVRYAVTKSLLDSMTFEHPAWFKRQQARGGEQSLHCTLSGEVLRFDRRLRLISTATKVQPIYRDALDALVCQIQEDVTFVCDAPEGQGRLLMLHLCAPNHWAATDRIGRSFQAAHAPVPRFERIARQTRALLANLRESGPYVRFAWGLATDSRLNHHPQPPRDCADPDAWHGRDFVPGHPRLFVRVERQVLTGVPAANGFSFAIRTYFTDATDLTPQQRRTLAAAIRNMESDIAQYKGLAGQRDTIAAWLESISPEH